MSPQSFSTNAGDFPCQRSMRDASLAYRVISDVSRGEELSDVVAQRANSNPNKITLHGVHGGASRMYGHGSRRGSCWQK
jgi:hypothetical protein